MHSDLLCASFPVGNNNTYDAVGNLTRIDDYKSGAPQSQVFGYDNLYRLTSAYASGGTGGSGDYTTESYYYDPNTGNLTSKTGVGSYSYGQQASGCLEGGLATPFRMPWLPQWERPRQPIATTKTAT